MANWRYANSANTIVYADFEDGHSESHLASSGIIQAWLADCNTPLPYEPPTVDPKAQAKAELSATDRDLARVAEDLIDALKTKGVISDSDLPGSVRDKLDHRKELRSKIK